MRLQIDGDKAELRRTCVAPDRQGEGLGTALSAMAEKMMPEHVSTITLFTGEHSESNLRLYRRLGYHETSRKPPVCTTWSIWPNRSDDTPTSALT
ncbi:GNAT family N-acetyltransferase [Mycobacterium sp. NPDC050441]|uniref:GNAT family N-acetyltransferase n=1 Tax=Mycobacterium sp. NPDC050441 TaxID=3155403 RepID=UPI0033C16010